jgi:hypothetical protein
MSYTVLPDGKFVVTFGGRTIPCRASLDCPGDALCFINRTWSAFPSQCACSLYFPRSGDECYDYDIAKGAAMFFLNLISLGFFSWALAISVLTLRKLPLISRKKQDSLRKPLILTALTTVVYGIWYGMARMIFDGGTIHYTQIGNLDKAAPVWYSVSAEFGFFLSAIMILEG